MQSDLFNVLEKMCLIWNQNMYFKIICLVCASIFLNGIVAPPVDPPKAEEKAENISLIDDFGLEYGRYLQQVIQTLESDKEFSEKMKNISVDQIRSGNIAKELEFVKHNVRSQLDELKRREIDRLRKIVQEQMEREELGLYRDEDGHMVNSPDGRRWRTLATKGLQGLNRKGVKLPKHVDVDNPSSFEVDDFKKLIHAATNDLEELDRKRHEEFKKYELEKEATYRENLKNMTEEKRKETEKHHQEILEKHKDHPKIHHPGSKPQLEEVWEQQDHMPKQEFNEKTFFAMHDINGDGHLDMEEVEAILIPEVRKMYNVNNEEDDPIEMEEEFHRMREHIFNETDKNRDGLISLKEFLQMAQQPEFQQDEGWKGLDEQQVYSEQELEEYMRQRQMQHEGYADPRMYYDVNAQYGVPPQMPHEQYPQGHPQQFQQGHPEQFQQGHPQQGQYQQQQFQQGHPQQQFQHPPQQGHPQQQFQGHPQQFQAPPQQGHPQQQFQAPPHQVHQGQPQQQFQAPPQQVHQGQPQQQFQAPPQQVHQGQTQQQFRAPPQQVQQGHPQQNLNAGNAQQVPVGNAGQPVAPQVHESGKQASSQINSANSQNQAAPVQPNSQGQTATH